MGKRIFTSTVAALGLFALVGLVAALAIAWPNLARAHTGDASLTALTVTPGTLSPAFSSTVIDYTVAVANTVTQITIEATADGDGSVAYQNTDGTTLTDADTNTAGQQVDLPAVGDKSINVVVTHGTDTQTYTVLVSREETDAPCDGGGYNPKPTAVEVDAVPIVVTSTTADYFVLYVSHDVDGTDVELPVLAKRGEAGSTTLAENVAALPKERYRVEKYLVADPADVDGDCTDDITELDNLGTMNPVNPAAAIDSSDGAVVVPDRATFEAFAFSQKFIKFIIFDIDTDRPGVYFINTTTHVLHNTFLDTVGHKRNEVVLGHMIYKPNLIAPDGSRGVYYYWGVGPSEPFSIAARTYTAVAASMPLLSDNLAFFVTPGALPVLQSELPSYRASRMNLVFNEDIAAGISFSALNPGEGYGLLRVLGPDQRPNSRDIVLYKVLPNNLPRVAGIISTVPQTPLSHVNLRAVQDRIPNAFIRGALDDSAIASLVDSYVHYTVNEAGYSVRAATLAEVNAHYASSRPATAQTPQRDLSVRAITPLSQIGFDDWDAFGVKAANVAMLGTLGFPEGTVPDGFAIPFYFYDEFMKHNNFYTRIETMLADPNFQDDYDTQESELKKLRKAIEDAETPQWIIEALTTMNESFAEGVNRRYRSSTNNEDLPGFNGAGLYDSKSQKPSEDEKDLAKSLKEVYASLWNFRAFTERDFHRIDHLAAAMGILVHPSYQDERVNGVAVSFDPFFGGDGKYYVNSQVGEDLVTNPEPHSAPEEILLEKGGVYSVLATSNLVKPGQLLMSNAQLSKLREHLGVIHERFEKLYNPAAGKPFAMEIEFKITSDDVLAIKQARPWVFGSAETITPPPTNQAPVFTDGASTTRSVAETTTAGVHIGAPVAATDPDNDPLTYSLGGTDAGSFDIVSGTGQLQTKASLDGASGNSYSVTVSVRDSKDDEGNPDTTTDSTIAVTILVTEVNEAPVFPSAMATRTIPENTPAGRNIGAPVAATDPDNDTLTYSLGGDDAASFDIYTSSGQLRTKAALDHEAKPEYSVTVIATDASSLMAELEVTITVGNVEEEGSVALFPAQPRVGTVLRATLSDPDGELRSVNWQWERSSDQTNWTSRSGSGPSYTPTSGDEGMYLRASASYTDGEGTGKSAEAASDHSVGAHDAAPDITVVELVSGLSIPWDLAFTPDGAMLFTQRPGVLSARLTDGTVQTVTADFGDLYVSREAGLMAIVIDPSFASNRRFYTCQTHAGPTVQVIAWTINAAFTAATRVNDPLVGGIPAASFHDGCRLRFGPQGYLWIATGDGASGTVPQDLTSLGGKVLRVDASTGAGAPGNPFASSPRVYTYGHRNPQGLARRPGTSQMWSVEHGPNIDDEINLLVKGGNYGWDPVPAYNQAVPMTDLGQFPGAIEARWSSGDPTLATSGGIFLDGDDWDEWEGRLAVATLKASELHIFDFTANGTFVSQVVVLELDGTYGRLRTPMMGPDGALYLTTSNGSGDRILKVVPSLPPTFPGETDTQAVDENRSASTIVATVTATDPEGQALTYTLSGRDAASFTIPNSAAGRLRAKATLNHEDRSSYQVIVTAADPYGLSDSVTLTISVTDVNETPAFPSSETGVRRVAETTAAGVNIGAPVAATDADNDALTYSLGGTDAGSFDIVSGTGQLQTKASLDGASGNSYSVTVSVRDSKDDEGNPDTTTDSTLAVTILVTEVNEAPVFPSATATRTIPENTPAGRNIGAPVAATDADNDLLTYSLGGPDAASFDIVASSGQLQTKLPLDGASGNSYSVTVSVRDSKDDEGNPDTTTDSTIAVTILVTEVNEAPVFPSAMATRTIPENTPAGVHIGAPVAASDPDNDPLTYSLGGTDAASFDIVASSGQLQTKLPLDRETKASYSVTVSVSDGDPDTAIDTTTTVTINVTTTATATATATATTSSRGGGGGGGSRATPTPTPSPTPTATPTPTGPQFSGQIAAEPSVTATVVPEGTTLGLNGGGDLPGGVYVNFPPTAVALPVPVSVSVSNEAPDDVTAPSGTTLLPLTIDITPATPLTLGEPLTIEINPTPELLEAAGGDLNNLAVGVVTPHGIVVLPTQVLHGRLVVTTDRLAPFVLVAITDSGPVLTQPPMGDASSMGPLLQWTQPPGTTWFQVQVIPFNEDGPGINLVIGDGALVRAAQYQVLGPNFGSADPNYVLLPDMTYLWRVRTSTVLTNPTAADWSAWAVSSFKTPPASSSTITRVSPPFFGEVRTLTPTLTWSNSNAAVFYYEVQVSRDFEFGPNAFLYSEYVHGGASTPANSYVVPEAFPLEAGEIYYWRVRPRIQGDGDPLPWSAINVFLTPG